MQAQEPNWVHVALWTRLAGFARADLEAAVERRDVVRSPLLRGTQHLAAADDYRWLRPTVRPVLSRLVWAAGVMDVQAWSGVTRLRQTVEKMRSELRVLRAPDGTELFDLPDAEFVDGQTPVPVRSCRCSTTGSSVTGIAAGSCPRRTARG